MMTCTSLCQQVMSLFEAKPRRRNRTQTSLDSVDCKVFRLCINADHCIRQLLVDSKWYFRAAQSCSVQRTASNINDAEQPPNQAPCQPASVHNDHRVDTVDNYFMDAHDDVHADATIIVNNQSQSAVTGDL